MISKNIPPHLLPLPPGDAGHDEGEGVVDVLVDQDQQGDAVGQLGQHQLGHGDHGGEGEDQHQVGGGHHGLHLLPRHAGLLHQHVVLQVV